LDELPARGLQALESPTLARRPSLPIDSRLSHRSLTATVPMRKRTEVSQQEMPLAGYLLARSLDGRKVEGQDLERLRRADESVREARALLPYGRGNVKEDDNASPGAATTQLAGGRGLKSDLAETLTTTSAIWAGAGNCGEHAALTTVAHAGRLNADLNEQVIIRGDRLFDHAWTESVIPRPWNISSLWKPAQGTIVLDAWKDGPAVFAVDSTRTQAQWLVSSALVTISQPQPELLADAKRDAQLIATEQDPSSLSKLRLPNGDLLNARSVVSSEFMQRVSAEPPATENVLATVQKSHGEGWETLHPAMPANVRKEILATSVVRDLLDAPEPLEHTLQGHGRVRSAADQAAAVIGALGDLRKVGPRQYRRRFSTFSIPSATFGAPSPQRLVRQPITAASAIPVQRRDADGLNGGGPSTESEVAQPR
jgi:hypothetical protein